MSHEMTPCKLPLLDGDGKSSTELITTVVQLEQAEYLRQAYQQDLASLDAILCAAWGLLLRCYTGQKSVGFQLWNKDGGRDAHDDIFTCQVEFSEEESLSACIQSAHQGCTSVKSRSITSGLADASSASTKISNSYNTSVIIESGHSVTAVDVVQGLRDNDSSHGHVWLVASGNHGRPELQLKAPGQAVSLGYLESLASTLDHVLTNITTSPHRLLADLEYVGQSQKRQISEWNQVPINHLNQCVHHQIYQQVLHQPEREAVCAWDATLTYCELWNHVQRLAHALRSLGIDRDSLVPVCFEKSVWTSVAVLAVLEAGAGFSLLDATQPDTRLKSFFSRLGAKFLLCSRNHAQKLSGLIDHVSVVDDAALRCLPEPPHGRVLRGSPSDVAYVVWTSGSTGEPKGIVIEHRAYCSASKAHVPALGIQSNSRVLQYASYVFDASILETLTPLMIGATVCVPNEQARLNDLPDSMNKFKVDWAELTPSVVNFLDPSTVPRLKTLLLVGEVMSQSHISTWSSIKLINAYGPAECSVAALANSEVVSNKEPTLIGNGIGVRCWLVDPENHDRLVPRGCVAELVIEGPTVARGYLNDLDRTRTSFIEDPAWAKSNVPQTMALGVRRMYKTGDLVRYHTVNNMLYFMGRKDTQVKLHGQRIELGEIESCLREVQGVRQSMVVLPKTGFCQKRLTAVISVEDIHASAEGLTLIDRSEQQKAKPVIAAARDRLSSVLPAFMLPSIWLVARSIPLLRSDKIDRRAVMDGVQNVTEQEYSQFVEGEVSEERPATELESQLRLIWGHVLNLRPTTIRLSQSFLTLGGDSISAMMVQSQCKKERIGITVQDILRAKSISHLASLTRAVGPNTKEEEKIEEDFDLSPIQSLFFELPNRGKGHFNQSFFVRLTENTQPATVLQATKAIVNRHSMLRARFRLSAFDDEWKQRITTDVTGSYSFHVHDCPSKEDTVPIMGKTQASLDAINGPLFAVNMFTLASGTQLLFLTGHHLVVDLVSWRVILHDLEEFLTNPKVSPEMEYSLSFQTWCRMQLEHTHKTPLRSVLPPDADIPPQGHTYWGMSDRVDTYGDVIWEGFELDVATTTIITTKCHGALRTETVDILVAAMLQSFSSSFTDRSPATIFTEGHGREVWDKTLDLSRTVGWFTTMYPVFIASAASDDFVDVLRRVKDFRRAVPANGRPYFASRLLTSKGAKKFRGHWPLEITFNYLGLYQQLEREDALLVPAEEMAGEARGAGGKSDVGHDTPRFGLFEISAVVAQGKLRFSFTFNRHIKHKDKIRNWISTCREALSEQPRRLAQMSYQPTLSDFPLITWTYKNLEELIKTRLPSLGIDVSNVEDIYSCSQIQQGLLISTQKDSAAYAIEGVYEITSKSGAQIISDKVAQAWQKVVNRHPSLRTIFVESPSRDDTLYEQIVLKQVVANIPRLRCGAADKIEHVLKSQSSMEYREDTPAHRFTLCETSSGKVFCRLEISHTIVDGTSMSIIFQELVAFYEGISLSLSGPLYSEYISFLQSQPPHASLGYWKSYLANVESCSFPVLNDAEYGDRQLHSKHFKLNNISHIQDVCNVYGVTLANVFHTAWAMTLQCYTRSEEVCYGYLMSTRDPAVTDVDQIVGYLINMLICRVSLSPESPLIAVMQQIQENLSEGQKHCQSALSEVLHGLKLAGTSLFNTSLSYRKLPLGTAAERHDVSFEECYPYYDPTEYSVSINIEVSEEGAAIDLDYWSDCLSDGHAANVVNTFLYAVQRIIDDSDVRLGQLNTISTFDRERILEWNRDMPQTIEKCVHQVVGEQASLRPDAAAIAAWDAQFTYSELTALGEKLANYLSLFGVGPESYVCLCFEKSAYTIVAMFAVLHAGGAFVALDPMHPAAALDLRIKDTQTQVILTSPCYQSLFADTGVHVVPIDRAFLDKLDTYKERMTTVEPHNPCCVIYTSGSTGNPKGVVLEHQALVTSSHAHGTALGIGQDSRFLQFSSYTFDNNLEEIFTTLMRGGTVCVPSDHERMNDLAGAATRLEANFMDLTPTVATYLNPAEMPTIKGMALGGEALTKTVLGVWGGAVQIHNQYGPSECSINSTHRTNIDKASDPASIGRSVGSVSWIVDPSNHDVLVPIGCEGELLIEGPILARGYLNDKEKTSKVFIENPQWAKAESQCSRRMYKTGDLVRYNSDGTISYIGRKDQQVKLHGQRIELGEIEFHTRIHLAADWQFAVELVTPGSKEGSVKGLAVFICPKADDTTSAHLSESGLLPVSTLLQTTFKSLEEALAKALPKHMVPSMYIPLVRLPLTSSGKLDRKQLLAVAKAMNENQLAMCRLAGSSGREPQTEIEKDLAALWENVLKLDPSTVGMSGQFFRLGGDSIAAIRLVTAARSKNIGLTVAIIFRYPTLTEMCENAIVTDTVERIEELEAFGLLPATIPNDLVVNEIATLCKVDPKSIKDVYPCTPIQEGLIALSNKQPGAYVAQNMYRLRSANISKFKEAWRTVVAEETVLRTRVVYTESLGFLQAIVDEPINWQHLERVEDLPVEEQLKPAFNGGSLTGYAIIQDDPNDALFVWTIHHSLFDGWSIELILNKVQAYYQASEIIRHPATASYTKFIQYLVTTDATESEAFWRTKLAGTIAPQYPMLPRPTYQPNGTSSIVHRMSISRGVGGETTMPTVIRAAWALTIAAYSNSADVVFAETVTGRDAPVPDIIDMMGPVFATVPVRIQMRDDLSINDYLKQIQDDFTEAMPHQQLGLQRIKRIDSDTAKACEFQNLIAINNGAPDSSDDFWKPENNGSDGSDFFTYALTLSFDVSATDVCLTAHYDNSVIPEWQLKRLVRYFESLMTRLLLRGSSRVDSIRGMHKEDEDTIKNWNNFSPILVERCIQELIHEKVNTLPYATPAICSWDANLTYQELDIAASACAHSLQKLGVGRQHYVPICFEKSALTIIVMLAVLKLGAAYVAIDGESPKARLLDIVNDVDAKAVLCSPRYHTICQSLGRRCSIVTLEAIMNTKKEFIRQPHYASSDIAYIIFTSGSTGKPKGTLVSHAAFVSGAKAHSPAMGLQASSRVLQFASYTFDASVVEIFSTLIMGACVCVPDEGARLNSITSVINNMNVDWALLTPSFTQLITPSEIPSLRTLVLGGEAVAQTQLAKWADKTHLVNAYGPSECAVVSTVNPYVSASSNPSNIGRAVGGRAFIVNQNDDSVLVPIGAIGELVVEGPILASGYLKNQEKTDAAFVKTPNWFGHLQLSPSITKSSLMYKTGDLVRYAEDGSFLYVGRKDNQSKLHGQRLELGEIEHHMGEVPEIQHGLALIPSCGLWEKKLVAVLSLVEKTPQDIVLNGRGVIVESSLVPKVRQHLSNHLPPYMIPSNWMILQDLPFLPSGKLDRRTISAWIQEMNEDSLQKLKELEPEEVGAQGSPVEQKLQSIWSKVLRLPPAQIGLDKNFLHLGGDSISALQVAAQCRNDGLSVTVKDIIRCHSISDLALNVTLPQTVQAGEEELDKPFDLSPMQRLFFDWMGDDVNHFNQSVLMELTQQRSSQVVSSALKGLVSAHSILRTRFERTSAHAWAQRIPREVNESYHFKVHSGVMSPEKVTSIVESSQRSLDIQKGPIFAADLFDSDGSAPQVLSLVVHHLVVDVVSWSIILEDLEHLLTANSLRLSLPFQLWSRLQNERTQSEGPKGFDLECGTPGPDYHYWGMSDKSNAHGVTMTRKFEIDRETTTRLQGPCHQMLKTELIDVLLGSILYAFCRAFPDREQVPPIFNEGHGREPWDSSIDLTRTLGWFTTISPVYLPAEGRQDDNILKVIRWVKDQRSRSTDKGRSYFAHRMLSPEGQQRFANHWPIEIAFNYLGNEKQITNTSSLFRPLENGSSEFDIGPTTPRFALFEISALIKEDKLTFSLSYNPAIKRQEGLQLWVDEIESCLHLASRKLDETQPEKTLSDFPLLPLGYSTIEILQERLSSAGVPAMADLEEVYGCSPIQKGLLLAQTKDATQYMYQTIFSATHTTSIDTQRLARAWKAVVQRHSSLRTMFVESLANDGLMDQVVVKTTLPKIIVHKVNAADAVQKLKQQTNIRFTDSQPYHQLTICECHDGNVFCKLEMSHAICDGTSVPILFQDLAKCYELDTAQTDPVSPYSRYISYIQQTSHEEDLAYWRQYLESVQPCHFPTMTNDLRVPRELKTHGIVLDETPHLQSFCAKHGVTLSNVLQLVWSLVLRSYTGDDTVCFGYISSGRDAPVQDIEKSVGAFISMLVCRMDLSANLPVSKALERIQSDYAQSMSHQAFSLGEMQHELHLSGKALFNTAFTFQRRPELRTADSNEPSFDVLEAEDPSEYDLTVNVEAREAAVEVDFNYWTDLLSTNQAIELSDTFSQILRSISHSEDAELVVGSIDSCSEKHRMQIMSWNQAPLPIVDRCVHDLIHQQSQSLPLATPAICSWDMDLTYVKLMALSKRLAKRLAALGVGPETKVPLCFEKSSWAVVAMLGVLQAGGAFVPLEPSHPDSRIKFIIDSTEARLVLCSAKYSDKFSDDIITFVVDEDLNRNVQTFPESDILLSSPANAAYLIFTSGTTGLPKGTIITHRAFATGATEHAPAILMRKKSRVLQFSNLCFDASIMEILTTLITGACVCIPSDEERMNDISGAINRMSVNWTLLTPSVANVLRPESVPSLQVLVTGGEAMQAGHIAKWRGKTSVVNAYGPSECAVIATTSIKVDENGDTQDEDPAVIGHAVGCRTWIVDSHNHSQLMPIGSVGELVVEGNTVARGYLNDQEKTAKAFVPYPSWMPSKVEGKVLYKTGDLVRYRSNGSIVYISRKDTQIKLNGLRIELGEIEHHVEKNLPEDAQSAVELVAPAGQQRTLAVFLAFSSQESQFAKIDSSTLDPLLLSMSEAEDIRCKALKSKLAGSLPGYMVPTLFVPLSQMPWTPSGKLDRIRLCRIVSALSKEDTAPYKLASLSNKRTPTTELEKMLGEFWEKLLGLEPATVSLDDNFFVLGGDSVQAMRLVAAARAEGILLRVLDIFRKPNLCEMAKACSYRDGNDGTTFSPFSLTANSDGFDQLLDEIVQQCGVEKQRLADAYPCSPLQEGLITSSIKQPGAYVAHNLFRLPEAVDIKRLKAAWERAVTEMEILRTRVVHTTSSNFVQVVLHQENIEWRTAERVEDVTDAPMLLPESNGSTLRRFTLITGLENYFVLSIHHALYDGMSLPKMLRRVEEIYSGDASTPTNVSYSHFIQYVSQIDPQESNQFWLSKFDGLQALNFPRLSSTASIGSTGTLAYTVQLPSRVSGTGITLPTMIRAAWAMVVSAHTGSEDVVFGETMTGRDVPVDGIIDILGPTLTTVPTRIQVQRTLSIMEFVQNVNQMAMEVIPYQHAGLQNIRRLSPELSTGCDFQNLLVIQAAEATEAVEANNMWEPQNTGVASNFFTYPLVVECNTKGSSVQIDAHYNEHVISKWHVQRLLGHLDSVLCQLCSVSRDDKTLLHEVRVMSEQDVESIKEWNNYQPKPVADCIHDLFLRQAELTPQAQAVCAWDGTFTYAELKRHAGTLAMYLKDLGVGPEVFVPFCMDKSRWALVAEMGVLIAGGGIVPFDPSHPLSRHFEIIEDTNAGVLLCSREYQSRYEKMVKTVIPVDERGISELALQNRGFAPSREVTSRNTAYVIYTSGSTGRPKGVVVEHRAFCTSSVAYCDAMRMTHDSRVFNFASVTFDVGLMENLSPLTMGACVCVPDNESKLTDIASAISSLSATWAFLTPSVANLIEPIAVPSLKTLVCGGEAMSMDNILKWADNLTLINGYGPTEASVISVVNPRVSIDKDPSNIGVAHANGHAWITETNDHNRLAPVGCVGELVLEGPLLAREYLHDEVKTKAAFVQDPAWTSQLTGMSDGSRRMYRTGDLVKYAPNGSLVFLGRKDNQIKLHGQRIELGEIEHNLELHPATQHAVTILPKSGLCKQRLVAVLSLAELYHGSNASAASGCVLIRDENRSKMVQGHLGQLREFVSNSLPAYMVPSIWVIVEAIPLLVSGKLDRKQVERWVEDLIQTDYQTITASQKETSASQPITESVQQLREIWASVFNIGVENIDPGKSFMSQGGDSLISMSIIARCRKIGIQLSLQEILQSKSLFQIADLLESKGRSSKVGQVTNCKETIDLPFDLSPIQKMYFELAGQSLDYTQKGRFNQSQLLRMARKSEPESIRDAIEIVVQQHSMFRARFSRNQQGIWQQRITQFASGAYRFREHQVDTLSQMLPILAESQNCLNIEKGPLLAVELFNTRTHGQVLSLIAHHLVIDVVSWGIILQQLEDILTFQSSAIEKPLSFQVWCSMQHEFARRRPSPIARNMLPFDVNKADLAFWNMTDGMNVYGDTKHESFLLDKSNSQMALGPSNEALRTQPIEIFVAALIQSFRQIFPQRSAPTIFNESHGRDAWDSSIDLTATTGWFTSLFPISIPNSNNSVEILKRAKDLHRSIPRNGTEYFAYRQLTPEGCSQFKDHTSMEVLLNYTGQSHQQEESRSLFQPMDLERNDDEERLTADVGPETTRMALFEVSVAAINNHIQFSFIYNKKMQRQDEIHQWIMQCQNTLVELVQELATRRPEPTLSDYPLLPTDYKGLQKHVNETFQEIGVPSVDEVEDMYACAPTQEGLLLSQIRDPTQYINHIIFEVQLSQGTQVDIARLAKAWQHVVDRHQSLRTAFVFSVCRGHAFDQIALKRVNASAKILRCEDSQYEQEFKKISLTEINRSRRPMLPHQLSICMTGSGRCYIKMELNHAVIDGGSVSLITRDLALAYENQLDESAKPLYSDYIKHINSLDANADSIFWKRYLKEIQRCHLPSLSGQKENKRLNAIDLQFDRFAELSAFCRANELTLSNVMLAAWGLVLRHYTSSDDVCFGNLTAGRDAPVEGIQDIVGAFINMLVCRVRFAKSDSIKTVLRTVQKDYLDCLPHQHCSLAKVQHDIGLTGEPLFNTAVSIQNQISSRDAERDASGIKIEPVSGHDPTEFSLTMNIHTAPGDEGARIQHWTSHMSVEEAEKLTLTYAKILGAIIASPDPTLESIDIATGRRPNVETHSELVHSIETKATESTEPIMNGSVHPQVYRDIVKECVRGVIDEMISQGHLARLANFSNQTSGAIGPGFEDYIPTVSADQSANNLKSLAKLEDSYPSADSSSTDVSQNMSKTVRSLWAPLLGIDEKQIRGNDSFFVLGGDSILAMELARAARDTNLPLTVADIFGSPGFSDMVDVVTRAQTKNRNLDTTHSSSTTENESISDEQEQEQSGRFGLLKAANAEAFIQDYICPKIGVFRGGIVDVLPVTDFQALAVTGTLVKSKWMMNYITFDAQGFLDLERIRKSALQLVQHFEILRTIFIPCGNRFLQVVLRNLRPQIFVYETDESFETYTDRLREQGPNATMKLGEPYVQFIVLRRPAGQQHRIIFRLSHAQYDGVCLPKMIEALKAGYEGQKLLPAPPFSKYVREVSGTAGREHYNYWEGLLRGSSMTSLVSRAQPEYGTSDIKTTVVRKTIELPPLSSKNITVATMLKAAWTLTLSRLLGRSDIVYGNLISGRNMSTAKVESIMGPCINIIPVRIRIDPNWTTMDLLRHVQTQQIAGMQYESLGFREIIQNCTEWPEWTYYSSIVQHQNLSEDVALQLDPTKYKVGMLSAQDTLADLTVISTPLGNDKVDVALDYVDNGIIPEEFVRKALDTVCTIARNFSGNANETIGTPSRSMNSSVRSYEPIQRSPSPRREHLLRDFDKSEVFEVADALRRAWRIVLPPKKQDATAMSLDSSFYNHGGDLVSLAALSAFLEEEGHKACLDDLMTRSTMVEQIALLVTNKMESRGDSKEQEAEVQELDVIEEQPKKVKGSRWAKPLGLVRKLGIRKSRQ